MRVVQYTKHDERENTCLMRMVQYIKQKKI